MRFRPARLTMLLVALSVVLLMLAGCAGSVLSTSTTGQVTTTGSTQVTTQVATRATTTTTGTTRIREDGRYSSPTDVALYLHTYHKLPRNFITKSAATKAGWESSKGNLWDVTDQMSIGGDVFGNREGLLPKKSGRVWYECDVNYAGGFRGGERIVYSNDGLIYYSKDHYANFTQLY